MSTGPNPAGLELTEEEAFALLGMCLTSPQAIDAISEKALRKLAEYCISRGNHKAKYQLEINSQSQASA